MANVELENVCREAAAVGIPIDTGQEISGLIEPSDPMYQEECVHWLSERYQVHQKKNGSNSGLGTWSSPLLRQASDYSIKHGVPVVLVHPYHESGAGYHPVSNRNGAIQLGLGASVTFGQETFAESLEHEVGHIKDDQIMLKYLENTNHPKLLELNEIIKTGRMSEEGTRTLIKALLEMMVQKVPSEERAQFEQQAKEVFGEVDSIKQEDLHRIAYMLIELFRIGEEAYDNELGHSPFEKDFGHFKKGSNFSYETHTFTSGKGKKIKGTQILLIATMQESRLWKYFKRRDFFDPNSIKDVDPTVVTFFRACIKASSNYHYK